MQRTGTGSRKNTKQKSQTLPTEFRAGFLGELDGRSELSRALKANFETIVNDIGGEQDLSHVKSALIERFCWLETILQSLEQKMATGKVDKEEALGKWIQGVNSLTGLAKTLGIERKMRTVDLKTYVAAEAQNTDGEK